VYNISYRYRSILTIRKHNSCQQRRSSLAYTYTIIALPGIRPILRKNFILACSTKYNEPTWNLIEKLVILAFIQNTNFKIGYDRLHKYDVSIDSV
jgi:hypothetical protein